MLNESLKKSLLLPKIYHYEVLGSSNDFAKIKLITNDLEEGSIILTDHQLYGRGRQNKKWYNGKPEDTLLCSIILKPPVSQSNLPLLSILSCLSLLQALINIDTSLPIGIKWPNDLFLEDKKCCGILCENVNSAVIIGIGLNIKWKNTEMPEEIKTIASSLNQHSKVKFDRINLLNKFISFLDENYAALIQSHTKELFNLINHYNFLYNKKIEVNGVKGKALEILSNGQLELIDDHGMMHFMHSGEVILC